MNEPRKTVYKIPQQLSRALHAPGEILDDEGKDHGKAEDRVAERLRPRTCEAGPSSPCSSTTARR